jgi:DNA-binding FadR family transcriptional regulator
LVDMTGDVADFRGVVVRRAPTRSAVADAIRRELLLGRVAEGQRLPPVAELAATLGAEIEEVREGLAELRRLGFAVGSGGRLVLREPAPDRELLRTAMGDDGQGVLWFTEFRAIIESGAASFAALRRTPQDLAAMEEAQVLLQTATTTIEARNADTAFHLAVAAAAQNPDVLSAVESVRLEIVGPLDLMRVQWIKDASYHGHQIILRAIREVRPDDAKEAMWNHIDTTRQEFEIELRGVRPETA